MINGNYTKTFAILLIFYISGYFLTCWCCSSVSSPGWISCAVVTPWSCWWEPAGTWRTWPSIWPCWWPWIWTLKKKNTYNWSSKYKKKINRLASNTNLHYLLLCVLYSLLLRCGLLYLLLWLNLHLNLHERTMLVTELLKTFISMTELFNGTIYDCLVYYRASKFQQWSCHLCAVCVDAVSFLLVDHSRSGGSSISTLLAELLQGIWTLAGQRLQKLLHAMLGDASSLLPNKLLIRASTIQGVIHCCQQCLLLLGVLGKGMINLLMFYLFTAIIHFLTTRTK